MIKINERREEGEDKGMRSIQVQMQSSSLLAAAAECCCC